MLMVNWYLDITVTKMAVLVEFAVWRNSIHTVLVKEKGSCIMQLPFL